jgi:hypothetical protein
MPSGESSSQKLSYLCKNVLANQIPENQENLDKLKKLGHFADFVTFRAMSSLPGDAPPSPPAQADIFGMRQLSTDQRCTEAQPTSQIGKDYQNDHHILPCLAHLSSS